jgi:hypothetical protein
MSKTITIKLDTAIPPKGKVVDLKRNMLTEPSRKDGKKTTTQGANLGQDVYYSDEFYYPTNLSREDMMKFLFNKEKFEEVKKNQPKVSPNDKEKVQKHNIMAILKCLFPVGYPVINDVDNSHSLLNGSSSANTLWFYPFRDYKSYITIDGDVYTVQRVVWLNDEFNYNNAFNKTKPSTSKTVDKNKYTNFVTVNSNEPVIVMLDLIKGEVNAENKRNIYCSYTGEMLGHKLTHFFKSKIKNHIDHSILYSIKDGKDIKGADEVMQTVKPEDEALAKEIENWRNTNSENRTMYDTFIKLFDKAKQADPKLESTMSISVYTSKDKILKAIKENEESSNLSGFYVFLKKPTKVVYDGAIDQFKDNKSNKVTYKNTNFMKIVGILLQVDLTTNTIKFDQSTQMMSGGSRNRTERNHPTHKKTRKCKI